MFLYFMLKNNYTGFNFAAISNTYTKSSHTKSKFLKNKTVFIKDYVF